MVNSVRTSDAGVPGQWQADTAVGQACDESCQYGNWLSVLGFQMWADLYPPGTFLSPSGSSRSPAAAPETQDTCNRWIEWGNKFAAGSNGLGIGSLSLSTLGLISSPALVTPAAALPSTLLAGASVLGWGADGAKWVSGALHRIGGVETPAMSQSVLTAGGGLLLGRLIPGSQALRLSAANREAYDRTTSTASVAGSVLGFTTVTITTGEYTSGC